MEGDAGSGWIGRSESRIKRWGVGSERKKEDTGQGRGGAIGWSETEREL